MKQQQKDVFWAAMVLRSKQVGSFIFFFFFNLVFCMLRCTVSIGVGNNKRLFSGRLWYLFRNKFFLFFFFFFFLLVFCLCRGREAMPGGSSNTRVTRKFTYRNGMWTEVNMHSPVFFELTRRYTLTIYYLILETYKCTITTTTIIITTTTI